ncbi:hypothetical protein [Sphingomonas sp. BAUL-RG-20F-R05-02]|nr:hypothetical protein [Sphingomonas sp. BAUL-RG-20F-R05-02]
MPALLNMPVAKPKADELVRRPSIYAPQISPQKRQNWCEVR